MSEAHKPRVFRLEADSAPRQGAKTVAITEVPDAFQAETLAALPAEQPLKPQAAGFSFWSKLFWSALGGLLSMAVGLWFWRLLEDLFRTNLYMGWIGTGLLALAALALLVLIIREARGLRSLDAATILRDEAELIAAADDGEGAKQVVRRLIAQQASDPTTAGARQQMQEHFSAIIDGRGLLLLAERLLILPRDAQAKAVIAAAAKRVSVVTAISPRAIVDVLFVAAQSVMLTRKLAEIYGARPGTLGFLRLGRRVLGHLAITGGMAMTDSVLSQLVGHGLAARLSAKLGEGVLNGLLTARVGLAVIAACRPLPFQPGDEPRLLDVAGDIIANPLGKRD